MANDKPEFDPEVMATMRKQLLAEVLEELSSKEEADRQRKILEREKNKVARDEYVTKMKSSNEPWVEVIGIEPTEQGIRTELDWNDAFIDYLKSQGIAGVDDGQVIQHYVTMLLRDMVEEMVEDEDSNYT